MKKKCINELVLVLVLGNFISFTFLLFSYGMLIRYVN